MWHHFCVSVNNSACKLDIGNQTYEVIHENIAKLPLMSEEVENVTMRLGLNTTAFEFFGQIADVCLFENPLSQAEIQSYSICEPTVTDALEYSTSDDTRRRVQERTRTSLCGRRPEHFAALFSGLRNQRASRKFCERLGARLINAKDDYSSVFNEIFLNMDDQDMLTTWTDKQLDDHYTMLFLAKVGNESSYINISLSSTTNAIKTLCLIPFGKKIYMLKDKREEYTLFPRRGRPVLQDSTGSLIFSSKCLHDKEKACMFYSTRNKITMYYESDDNDFILGRHKWYAREMAQGASQRVIYATMTACNETQFTCNDSQCIDLEKRCNGMAECNDLSDEGDTCKAMDNLPPTYWPSMCPRLSGNPPPIGLYVKLFSIGEISLENNEFKATLRVDIYWKDNRLLFSNLGQCINILDSKLSKAIWVPEITFDNAYYDDNRHIQQGTEILERYSVEANGTNYTDVLESFEGECLLLLSILTMVYENVNENATSRVRNFFFFFTFSQAQLSIFIYKLLS